MPDLLCVFAPARTHGFPLDAGRLRGRTPLQTVPRYSLVDLGDRSVCKSRTMNCVRGCTPRAISGKSACAPPGVDIFPYRITVSLGKAAVRINRYEPWSVRTACGLVDALSPTCAGYLRAPFRPCVLGSVPEGIRSHASLPLIGPIVATCAPNPLQYPSRCKS